MAQLEAKKIKGKTYYYCCEWGWVGGKSKRLWQKYLGTLETIVKAVEGAGPKPKYAEVFNWGLPTALWNESMAAEVIKIVDKFCPKRDQGLTTGAYLVIAAINRAIRPRSKRSMWSWFSETTLLRYLPDASLQALSSQRFWDHMDRIDTNTAKSIWKQIIKGVVEREDIDLSSISYDGTNFYTFIDTFNTRCQIAKRGKNKQGRNNLRQVSYALFCCADGHTPLYYDVYEGNRNDSKQFKKVIKNFDKFFKELSKGDEVPDTTVIFDKGNNSGGNFKLLDKMKFHYVGSVKLGEHKELAEISNNDSSFTPCSSNQLKGTKAFRVQKKVYGKERTLVVTYNKNLFNTQWLTLQNDIRKAVESLSILQQKLDDRIKGIITKGKCPTLKSVESQCNDILGRPFLDSIITTKVTLGCNDIPQLEYEIDSCTLQKKADTYLGKNIIITDRKEWDNARIIKAYRSQFIIEGVFQEMKDREIGSWWPLFHWTDSKIQVHGLYCTIALLIRAVMLRRLQRAGLYISMKRTLEALNNIREVVNVYPKKKKNKSNPVQTVLSKLSELQKKLISILALNKKNISMLG